MHIIGFSECPIIRQFEGARRHHVTISLSCGSLVTDLSIHINEYRPDMGGVEAINNRNRGIVSSDINVNEIAFDSTMNNKPFASPVDATRANRDFDAFHIEAMVIGAFCFCSCNGRILQRANELPQLGALELDIGKDDVGEFDLSPPGLRLAAVAIGLGDARLCSFQPLEEKPLTDLNVIPVEALGAERALCDEPLTKLDSVHALMNELLRCRHGIVIIVGYQFINLIITKHLTNFERHFGHMLALKVEF